MRFGEVFGPIPTDSYKFWLCGKFLSSVNFLVSRNHAPVLVPCTLFGIRLPKRIMLVCDIIDTLLVLLSNAPTCCKMFWYEFHRYKGFSQIFYFLLLLRKSQVQRHLWSLILIRAGISVCALKRFKVSHSSRFDFIAQMFIIF